MQIKDISDQAKLSPRVQVYIIATVVESNVKKAKGGKPYFEIVLRDDSGTINAKRFLTDESQLPIIKRSYSANVILDINGTYEKKYKSITIESESIVDIIEPTTDIESEILIDDLPATTIEEMSTYLKGVIKTITNGWMISLLRAVFNDQRTRDEFLLCPAGVSNHHAYKGGLLHHVVGMLKILDTLIVDHPNHSMNSDLLKTGIIIHDIGKIRVYKLENGKAEYLRTDIRLDHVQIGGTLLDSFMNNINGFPADIKQQIHRIIASHHGKLEWGATIMPVHDEETIIHCLDLMDARFSRRSGRQTESVDNR